MSFPSAFGRLWKFKMTESMIWCLVLLTNVPSRWPSGTEIDTMSVCQGDDVQLFRNVAFGSGRVVSVYINGNNPRAIATGNSLSTFSISSKYKGKLFLDELETFWIRQIQRSDEKKYILRYETDNRTTNYEVQIIVMDAPTKHCRPKLSKVDNVLSASLDSDECGHPSASVKWVEYPGISYVDNLRLILPSGKESGTYYACAESPALKCVRDLKLSDYCSSYVVEAHSSPAVSPSNTQLSSEMLLMIVILILVLVILAVVTTILVKQNKRFNEISARDQLRNSLLVRRSNDENESSV